mgnify:CR=1 FL=1
MTTILTTTFFPVTRLPTGALRGDLPRRTGQLSAHWRPPAKAVPPERVPVADVRSGGHLQSEHRTSSLLQGHRLHRQGAHHLGDAHRVDDLRTGHHSHGRHSGDAFLQSWLVQFKDYILPLLFYPSHLSFRRRRRGPRHPRDAGQHRHCLHRLPATSGEGAASTRWPSLCTSAHLHRWPPDAWPCRVWS